MKYVFRILIITVFITSLVNETIGCVITGRILTDSFFIPDSTYEYEKFDNYFYNYYDVIFIGRVTKITPPDNFIDDIIYEFEIDLIQSIKGVESKKLKISNNQSCGNCSLDAKIGDIVIIWGNFRGFLSKKIFADGCYPNYVVDKKNIEFYSFIEKKNYLNQNDTIYDIKRLIDYTKYDNNHVETHFSNGRFACIGDYKSGKPHGLWKYYDLNGNIVEYGYYNEGLKINKWYYYRPGNNLCVIQNFKNGNLHGLSKYNIWENQSNDKYYFKGLEIPKVVWNLRYFVQGLILLLIILPIILKIRRKFNKSNKLSIE